MLACGCAWLRSRLRALDSGRGVAAWEVSAPEECRSLSHQRNAGVVEGGQRLGTISIPRDAGKCRGESSRSCKNRSHALSSLQLSMLGEGKGWGEGFPS